MEADISSMEEATPVVAWLMRVDVSDIDFVLTESSSPAEATVLAWAVVCSATAAWL
jgi:hypothetical protein